MRFLQRSGKEITLFKSGYIGIIGRPNVGKSTLLNTIIGERIAITTPKPQTTRNRIMGIRNVTNGQMIFLDTPGIHKASTPLNQLMVNTATETFRNADLLLLLVEANVGLHRGDLAIIRSLEKVRRPVILVVNKTDLVPKDTLPTLVTAFQETFSFADTLPLSALIGNGVDALLDKLWQFLPEGPPYFPADQMTDRSERFVAAEIVREQVLLLTHQEIPYSTAVLVETFKEDEAKNLISIQATIHVEKDSQKGILIGKKGAMLKKIGTAARLEMEKFFAARIYLELFVRIQKDWTHDKRMLREFGYIDQ